MLLQLIATTSADVAATSSRLAKVERIVECLRAAAPEEVAVAVAYLSGVLPQGTVGVGWAALRELPAPADEPTLEVLEVDAAVSRMQSIAGKGSQTARREELAALFARATEPEQRLLTGLFLGELRQGALEGVMTDAVAKAAGVPLADVRRAVMLAGDLRFRRGDRDARRERRAGAVPADAAAPDRPDARADGRRHRGRSRAARVHATSSGSSTARGSRCTGSATTSRSSRATSRTSPTACRRSSTAVRELDV